MPRLVASRALQALLLGLALALPAAASDRRTDVPETVSQGGLVRGTTAVGNRVRLDGRPLRVDAAGRFVFGVGRDRRDPLRLQVRWFDGASETVNLKVLPRDWPIEHVQGVPPPRSTRRPRSPHASRASRQRSRRPAYATTRAAISPPSSTGRWPVASAAASAARAATTASPVRRIPAPTSRLRPARPCARRRRAWSASSGRTSTSPAARCCSTTATACRPPSCT